MWRFNIACWRVKSEAFDEKQAPNLLDKGGIEHEKKETEVKNAIGAKEVESSVTNIIVELNYEGHCVGVCWKSK